MHQRFAAIAGCLGALVLLRLARVPNAAAKAVAFLAAPAVSALAWVAFFIAIYGTPDPTAPFGNEVRSLGFIPGALTALLFDQRFGLLAYAPAVAIAFGGLGHDAVPARAPSSCARSALHAGAVPAGRHRRGDVVGRAQRAGTVLHAGLVAPGDPGRLRVGIHAQPHRAGNGSRRTRLHLVCFVRPGLRRGRASRIQRSGDVRLLARMAQRRRRSRAGPSVVVARQRGKPVPGRGRVGRRAGRGVDRPARNRAAVPGCARAPRSRR